MAATTSGILWRRLLKMAANQLDKVDLDELLKDYEVFKSACHAVVLENKKLKIEIGLTKSHSEQVEDERKTLLNDVSNLRSLVFVQQENLSKISSYEDENKELVEKVLVLENKVQEMKMKHEEEVKAVQLKLVESEMSYKAKLEEIRKQSEDVLRSVKDTHVKQIQEKESDIRRYNERYEILQKDSQEKIIKLELQHEGTLLKLKEQIARLSKSRTSVGLANLNDTFRKKVQQLQKDYEEKISHLQLRISELESVDVIPESPKRKSFRKWLS